VPDRVMWNNPRVSPVLAGSGEFPETMVTFICEGDMLGPEAVALAENFR